MKKILSIILILNSFIFANKAYDISSEDYEKYKDNPKMMIKIFKNRFLNIKKEEVASKEVIVSNTNDNKELKVQEKIVKTTEVKKIIKTKALNIKKVVAIKKIKAKEIIKEKEIKTTKIVKSKELKNANTKKIIEVKEVKISEVEQIAEPIIIIKKVTKIKINEFYSYDEVKNKLNYNKILKENDIDKLLVSIDHILIDSGNRYNTKEIKYVLKEINNKRISKFESKIYLNQIKNILRDEI